jgi:hypothetical protein
MTIIPIPVKGVSPQLRTKIESKLPEPLKVPGWKFNGYCWRLLTQINTKDSEGSTDNSVRIAGTGDNETLQSSLRKGIDITELTPSIYPNDNLMNGFNRVKNLLEIGYKEWIFAEYVEDESTRSEFQECFNDCLDDFRASANKGKGQKVISDKEVEELGRKRFQNRKDQSKQSISKWIRTLDLNWSGQKIDGVSNKICKDFTRKGVIESFNRDEAQQFLTDNGIGADLLNTKDSTRVARLYPQIMRNFVKNGVTMDLALFDSDACSHEELDNRQKETIDELKEYDDLVMQYAVKRMSMLSIHPWNIIGSISQKIGVEEQKLKNGLVIVE